MARDLIETVGNRLQLHFHKGQLEGWNSKARFILLLAGTQGGKTSFGPHWLMREMQQQGPGDYMVVTPSYPLLSKKALPEFLRVFKDLFGLGDYNKSDKIFTVSDVGFERLYGRKVGDDPPTQIFFGYAADPDSLESATAKAAWCDEAGQKKFKLASWQAILRRLSLSMGRALITTTPYYLGWLKTELWDKRNTDPEIDVIRFESIMNPLFPREEWDRAKGSLPGWKFDLFYRALFTKPAGVIYDCFDSEMHVIPPFAIPADWPRFLGLDFGGVNTAGLFYARKPDTNQLILYREYLAGGRTSAEHAGELLKSEPLIPQCVGGSRSEGQWRREFAAGGLSIRPPDIADVEVGIDRVYGAHKRNEILIFDTCTGYLDEKASYSRKLDDNDEPTEEIEDKNDFHFMDAERYIVGWLNKAQTWTAKSRQG